MSTQENDLAKNERFCKWVAGALCAGTHTISDIMEAYNISREKVLECDEIGSEMVLQQLRSGRGNGENES